MPIQKVDDPNSFDEFKNQDYADWKRVRLAIEHENGLTNHRLTWLFTSQGFLFTAFALALNAWKTSPAAGKESYPALLTVIAFLAVSVCLLIWRGLIDAQIQLRRLDRWWHAEDRDKLTLADLEAPYSRRDLTRLASMQKKLPHHPPLQGEGQTAWDRWFNANTIPVFFIVGWALIVMFVVLEISSGITNVLRDYGLRGLSYLLIVVATLVVREYFARRHK